MCATLAALAAETAAEEAAEAEVGEAVEAAAETEAVVVAAGSLLFSMCATLEQQPAHFVSLIRDSKESDYHSAHSISIIR